MDNPKINWNKLKLCKIFIATPCFSGMLTDAYAIGLLGLVQIFERERISYTVNLMGNQSLITRARNKLAAMFMTDRNNTHLMFIDGDIAFDPKDVIKLLNHGKEITAGVYPKKGIHWDVVKTAVEANDPEFWNMGTNFNLALNFLSEKKKSVKIQGRLVGAKYVGAGFLLIKRAVFNKIIKAQPKRKCYDDEEFEKKYGKYYYDIFATEVDAKTKLYLSEDYAFCKLVRSLGMEIWADTSINLGHVGTYTYSGNLDRWLGVTLKKE